MGNSPKVIEGTEKIVRHSEVRGSIVRDTELIYKGYY